MSGGESLGGPPAAAASCSDDDGGDGTDCTEDDADAPVPLLCMQPAALAARACGMRPFGVGVGHRGRCAGVPEFLGQRAPGISAQMREPQRGKFCSHPSSSAGVGSTPSGSNLRMLTNLVETSISHDKGNWSEFLETFKKIS